MIDPDMPSNNAEVLDLNTADGKLLAKAKQKNKLAMANLTMALVFEGMVGIINASNNTLWPSGLVCHVVDLLHKCSVPQDRIS